MPIQPTKQRHLDDAERHQIAHLYALGRSATNIAKDMQRDKSTVLNAVRNDGKVKALIAAQTEELAVLFEQVARQAISHITDAKLESSSARDLGVLSGIMVDKSRLLNGQSGLNIAVLLGGIGNAADMYGKARQGDLVDAEIITD